MEHQQPYTKGDRVRLVCDCPGGQAGDEGTVVAIRHPTPDGVKSLDILIDTNPATSHGTTVLEHEIEPVTPKP